MSVLRLSKQLRLVGVWHKGGRELMGLVGLSYWGFYVRGCTQAPSKEVGGVEEDGPRLTSTPTEHSSLPLSTCAYRRPRQVEALISLCVLRLKSPPSSPRTKRRVLNRIEVPCYSEGRLHSKHQSLTYKT